MQPRLIVVVLFATAAFLGVYTVGQVGGAAEPPAAPSRPLPVHQGAIPATTQPISPGPALRVPALGRKRRAPRDSAPAALAGISTERARPCDPTPAHTRARTCACTCAPPRPAPSPARPPKAKPFYDAG